jgi:hypothetical protein
MTKSELQAALADAEERAARYGTALADAVNLRHFPGPSGTDLVVDVPSPEWFIALTAEWLCASLEAVGAANCVEWRIAHSRLGALSLTLQRQDGKTPLELRTIAEAERDQVRQELAEAQVERLRLRAALVGLEFAGSRETCLFCGGYCEHTEGCEWVALAGGKE